MLLLCKILWYEPHLRWDWQFLPRGPSRCTGFCKLILVPVTVSISEYKKRLQTGRQNLSVSLFVSGLYLNNFLLNRILDQLPPVV